MSDEEIVELRKKQIKREVNKMKKEIKDVISDKKVQSAHRMIEEIAFLRVMMEEMKELIIEEGSIGILKQGPQVLEIETKAVKMYREYLKQFVTVHNSYVNLFPKDLVVDQNEEDKLAEFLRSGKA